MCQAHYIAKRANDFCKDNTIDRLVWAGDFNSQPCGSVHQYLTKGVVNAKEAAPWYTVSTKNRKDNAGLGAQKLHRLNISDETIDNIIESEEKSSPNVRYLLDYTLNRFCRWLRILGLDAALETEEEERERTRDGKM